MARDLLLGFMITQPPPGKSSADFMLFAGNHFLPHMVGYDAALPWEQQDECCVLILDNARVHDGAGLDLIQAAGVLVLRLPQYIADFNPIEDVSSVGSS